MKNCIKNYSVTLFLLLFLSFSILDVKSQSCTPVASNSGTKNLNEVYDALFKAANDGDLEKVKKIIEGKGIDVDQRLENEATLLLIAGYRGNKELAEYVLNKGGDINIRNRQNSTALHNAAARGHIEVARFLLEKGQDVNVKGVSDFTPLHQACLRRRVTMVKFLLEEAKADPNARAIEGITPLIYATWGGNMEILKLLVKNGANVNAKTDESSTAIFSSIQAGNKEVLDFLLSQNADPNIINKDNVSPLYIAIQGGKTELVKILLPLTKKIDLKEKHYGNTPLHMAAINGDITTTKMLLNSGANPEIKNKAGITAVSYAAMYGYNALVKLYIAKGVVGNEYLKKSEMTSQMARIPLNKGEAKVVYTGHSGWIILTGDKVLVFDYWSNVIPETNESIANGIFCCDELKDKEVYVFTSHSHGDHFDTITYSWTDKLENVVYIFGFKPEDLRRYSKNGYTGPDYTYIPDNQIKVVNNIKVATIKSNDTGQGFLVEVDGLKIYHPGDHALFTEEDKPIFVKEVDYLDSISDEIDIAFLPVTGCPSRWQKEYIIEGFFYNIDKLHPKIVFPMHASQREYLLKEFEEVAKERNTPAKIICVENKGDRYIYKEKDLAFAK